MRVFLRFMKYYDMEKYFDDIIYIDGHHVKKPNSEMFEYLVNKYNIDVKETLSIGDRDLDLVPSTKLGIDTCLFRPYSDKLTYKPKYIIQDMKELYNIIK